jgi:hypothetical protein
MTISTPKQRPVPKAQLLPYLIGSVMVVLFVYGLIRYPDLPIRECPSGYCGKQGQPTQLPSTALSMHGKLH